MRMDFTNVEITGIIYKYEKDEALWGTRTQVFVFLKETAELESKDYYFDRNGGGISDPNLEHIPPGNIAELNEIGIELFQLQKHGGNYSQMRVGFQIIPYPIHWYQIDESYDGKSNVVLDASIPRKISMDVDKIIQEKYRVNY